LGRTQKYSVGNVGRGVIFLHVLIGRTYAALTAFSESDKLAVYICNPTLFSEIKIQTMNGWRPLDTQTLYKMKIKPKILPKQLGLFLPLILIECILDKSDAFIGCVLAVAILVIALAALIYALKI
jgi:hypothetical protein